MKLGLSKNMVSISLLTSLPTLVRTVGLLILNKTIAIYVGVSGYGALGQYQSLISTFNSLAAAISTTPVTKFTAQLEGYQSLQHKMWRAATFIAGSSGLLLLALILPISASISEYVFGTNQYSHIIIITPIFFIIGSINTTLLAILTGLNKYKESMIASVSGTIFGFGLSILLVQYQGISGAIWGLAAQGAIALCPTILLCRKRDWLRVKNLVGVPSVEAATEVLKCSSMVVGAAIFTMLAQLCIRNYIAGRYGWDEVGYWEAAFRISGICFLLTSTPISLYILPAFSKVSSKTALIKTLKLSLIQMVVVAMIANGLVYAMRGYVSKLFLSHNFSPVDNLVGWQLFGDVFKSACFVIGYLMIGRGMVLGYLAIEALFSLLWVGLSVLFIRKIGVGGAQIGYALAYVLMLLAQAYYMRTWFERYKENAEIV